MENTGSDMQLFCDTGGGAFIGVQTASGRKEGDKIWLQPKLAGVHLFDAQSGQRIACGRDIKVAMKLYTLDETCLKTPGRAQPFSPLQLALSKLVSEADILRREAPERGT